MGLLVTDHRPHSRACGIEQHPHGPACSPDCPTCLEWAGGTQAPPAQDWDTITPDNPIQFPCIAVPEGFTGTESEAVGLAVAGAFAALEKERDAAGAEAVRQADAGAEAHAIILELVTHFPETSWAHDAHLLGRANEWLERHKVNPEPGT